MDTMDRNPHAAPAKNTPDAPDDATDPLATNYDAPTEPPEDPIDAAPDLKSNKQRLILFAAGAVGLIAFAVIARMAT